MEVSNDSCASCNRMNCNGVVHKANDIYPICERCGIELLDLIELLNNNKLRNQHSCELCPYNYTSRTDFIDHFPSHFYKGSPRHETTFYCLTCSDEYNLKNSVKLKWLQHNVPNKSDNITNKKKVVSISKDDNAEEAGKKEFQINEHTEETDELPTEYCKNMFSDVSRLHCKTCKKGFGTELELEFHQSNYHNKIKVKHKDAIEELHECLLCEEQFPSRTKRLAHMREKHMDKETNTFPCPYCEKSFYLRKIADHLNTHENRIRHLCNICGKTFCRISNLQNHYATHNQNPSYKCHLCPKSFKTHPLRLKHINYIHLENKRVQCEQCERFFKDRSDLRRHRWTHGGYEKKFKCDVCGRSFYENKVLRKHMNIHEHRV